MLRAFVLTLALLAFAGGARAQNKSSRPYAIVVGHVVNISWNASTSLSVTYNIYVGGTSGGPYTKIGNTASLQFKDLNATAGNTYFYVITALNSSGEESVFSREVSVTILIP